ncbi:MAG TPA: MFS transporter, partial [Halococcus sp.]|nr:MFS transporter [Halococcus sp.]
ASSLYFYAGIVLAATLFGWGVGGVLRGLTVRFIGRRNTATYSVLGYGIFTLLTAFSGTYLVFVSLRFLTGVMLGSAGEGESVFLAETHTDGRHARGGGSVYAGFGFGILLASVAWFVIQTLDPQLLSGSLGAGAWRYLFIIGVVPMIFTLYLRRRAEPPEQRAEERDSGAEPTPITLSGIFGSSSLRGRIVVCVVTLFASIAGWWGIAAWIPIYASSIATDAGLAQPIRWAAVAGVVYGIGAIVGCLTVEPITDRIGRIGSLMFMLIGAGAAVQVLFLLLRTPYLLLVFVAVFGYFSVGQLGWFAVYLPELFPRAGRGVALGTIYTIARLLAVFFPILVGIEITYFEGLTTVVPSLAMVYGVGIFVSLFLPLGMDSPVPEEHSS